MLNATTTVQMEIERWSFDRGHNLISGIVVFDLTKRFRKGSLFKSPITEFKEFSKFTLFRVSDDCVVIAYPRV